jgi:hypothetical protein
VLSKPALLLLGSLMIWICSSFFVLASEAVEPLLDQDEIYWIGSSYYYDLAFVKHDWAHPAWKLLPARENPPVAKYVIGLGLAGAGYRVTSIDCLSYFYLSWLGWEKDPDIQGTGPDTAKRVQVIEAAAPDFRKNVLANMRAPLTRPMVQAARNTIMVCVAVASLLLLILIARSGDWVAGLIASQLMLLHPVISSVSGRAMSDTVALMFSMAAVLGAFTWFGHFSRSLNLPFKHGLPYSFITGLLAAFACGAKMNSLVVVILIGVLTATLMVQKWTSKRRREAIKTGIHGSIILLTGLAAFILINPAILQDVPGGLAATVLEHQRSLALQTDITNSPHLTNFRAKLGAVVSIGFFNWTTFGIMVAIVGWLIAFRWNTPGIRFAVCWWLVALVCVTLWIPLPWQRYVIPVLPPSVWLIGCFVSPLGPHFYQTLSGNSIRRNKPALGATK